MGSHAPPSRHKRICHPFTCRLPEESIFDAGHRCSLVGTGFVTMAIGIFTAFRPSPLLLLELIRKLKSKDPDLELFKKVSQICVLCWIIFIVSILLIDGLLMACSRFITNRSVLLISPWILLILYADPLFWGICTVYIHVKSSSEHPYTWAFERISHPIYFFVIIYIDIILFFIVHYLFASYYIVAQLTVIEKNY